MPDQIKREELRDRLANITLGRLNGSDEDRILDLIEQHDTERERFAINTAIQDIRDSTLVSDNGTVDWFLLDAKLTTLTNTKKEEAE